ncbi:hypothetical protein GCM10027074_19060 [Streptomyces deserti]
MLAIASLATGFVVAAVTPSHALGEGIGTLSADDALGTLDKTVHAEDGLALDDGTSAKDGAKPGKDG